MINKKLLCGAIFIFGILIFISSVSAYTESYYGSEYNHAMGILSLSGGQSLKVDESMCQQGTDFIIQIGKCEPAPVTSDLLEEENVNVFCKMSAIKINPLIDVKAIDQISFDREIPKEVMAIGYQPAQSALGYTENTLEGSLILENLGYVVITLKRQPNESALTNCEKSPLPIGGDICWVQGNLTAKLRYDVENVFGVGNAIFYLPYMEDKDWQNNFVQYSFWGGRGYLRAESVGENSASVSIYSDNSVASSLSRTGREYTLAKYVTRNIEVGKTSEKIFLPGISPCLASLELTLQGIEYPDTRARLKVNGDSFEVAEGEYFLDNKCRVISMDGNEINSQVKIRCDGADDSSERKAFDLMIFPNVKLKIGAETGNYTVGNWLYRTEDGKKSVYLGYVGTIGTKEEKDLYVYLVAIPEHKDRLSDSQISLVAAYAETVRSSTKGRGKVMTEIIDTSSTIAALIGRGAESIIGGWDYYAISYTGPTQQASSVKVGGKDVSFEGYAVETGDGFFPLSNTNYTNAMSDFDTVINSYPNEVEKVNSIETFGQQAEYEEISLAYKLGKTKILIELCNKFEQDYPKEYRYVDICQDDLMLSNSGVNTKEVTINGFTKEISLQEINEPSVNDYSATLVVQGPKGTKSFTLRKNEPVYLAGNGLRSADDENNLNNTEYIMLQELEDGSAKILVNVEGQKNVKGVYEDLFSSDSLYFTKDIYQPKGVYKFTLTDIKLKKIAKVSIKANTDLARSNSSFTFKIGVEKRAIQLSPERTKSRIDSMNETIEKWKKASDTFDSVVTVWKGTCAVTGGWLTLKNAYLNRGGKATARQQVMTGAGGWDEKCAQLVPRTFKSIDECFSKNADDIERQVTDTFSIMKSQDSNITQLKTKYTTDKEFNEQYSKQVSTELGSLSNNTNLKNVETVQKVLNANGWEQNKYTTEQAKEIELYTLYLQTHPNDELALKRLNSTLADVEVNSRKFLEGETFKKGTGLTTNNVHVSYVAKSPNDEQIVVGGENEKVLFKGSIYDKMQFEDAADRTTIPDTSYFEIYSNSNSVSTVTHKMREFLVIYNANGVVTHTFEVDRTGTEPVLKMYKDTVTVKDPDTKKDTVVSKVVTNPFGLFFPPYDKTSNQNTYLSSYGGSEPLIRYFETGTYKGKPSIVPFDLKNGFYAAIQNPAISYDASGRLTSLYVCNVGENGVEEFQLDHFGGDTCTLYSLTANQKDFPWFPGLDLTATINLVNRAKTAVEAAQRARVGKDGLTSVKIDGSGNNKAIKVGEPALESLTAQCTDFMSVKDCAILFNVCDPVVCPSSRCDFGGKYPVQNVIQSGIVGSIFLCYPNAKWKGGDVYVPFCLSGVNAGVKSWISVMESHRDCLQTALNTGETVGICDETNSIYTCQFFWKQTIPIIKLVGKGLIDKVTGKSAKGGGEYQGLTSALKTAKESVDYFTQYYASNSYNAFKIRSTQQFGTDAICGTFISAVVPGGDLSDFLGNLFNPDVPFQFTGKFEETQLTTVTNPPTSHYKVYFHIYAGEDTGAYYTVYLRGSGSSYYQDTAQNRLVKSSYIARGKYADETVDFTAPSGYSQLCIVVNGQEECGFKEVSSSFAVNYLSDLYLAEQANKTDIETTKACTSGSLSLYSLLDINVQSALENELSPELYNQGITRVCSTQNPGLGTDVNAESEGAKWKQVGHCDDTAMGCWLNIQSVKDAIKFLNLEESTLGKVSEDAVGYLSKEYLDQGTFYSKMEEIKAETDDTKRITLINSIINAVYFNNQKAGLYFWRGKSYSNLAVKDHNDILAARIAAGTSCNNDVTRACTIGNCAGTQICINNQWGACTKTDSNCDIGTTTGNNVVNSFNAKYLSPSFRINDGNIFTSNSICYRYYNSKWQWIVTCTGTVSSLTHWNDASALKEGIESGEISNVKEKDQLIINGLATQDGDYIGGLSWLVYKVLANTKGGLSDPTFTTTTMDGDGIFAVKFPDSTYQPTKTIYYKYQSNQWFWQLDDSYEGGGVWQSVSIVPTSFNLEQKMIANALKSLDLNNGAAILFDYSSGDIQDLFKIGTEYCADTCTSLGYQCGTQTVCGKNVNCGSCTVSGQTCNAVGKCVTGGTGTTTNREVFLITATDIQKFLGKTDIYYKYENAWKWTPYWKSFSESPDSVWISTSSPVITTGDLTGKQPTSKNVGIIEEINGKSYVDGKRILKDNDGTMEDGSEIVLGTTGTTTCVDTCNSLGYECGTQTVCSKSVNCGTCTTAGQTCNLLGKCIASTTATDARQKVLDAAVSLEGTSRLGLTDLDGSGGSPNCWDSVQYVYEKAGVTWDCIYSDNKGKEYTHDETKIIMGVTENKYNQILYVTSTSCDNVGLSETAKLNLLQPGDILSIVFNEAAGHNVIFIGWDDKSNWKARVFDWGAFTGSRKFEYNIIDLNDNQYSVYRDWKPQ